MAYSASTDFEERRLRIQEALRSTASTSGRPRDLLPDGLLDALPTMMQNIKAGEPAERQNHRDRTMLHNAARALAAQFSRDAAAADVSPMQYQPPGVGLAVLPQLLEITRFMCEKGYTDSVLLVQMLEDILETTTINHCGHVFSWLEAYVQSLRGTDGLNMAFGTQMARLPLLRTSNMLLRRLSKATELALCARVMLLMSQVFPLQERSALNISATVNTSHTTTIDEVPPGAVDSNGEPVDSSFYTTFWKLQKYLQNPKHAIETNDSWSHVHASISSVLSEFGKRPVTVPASTRRLATISSDVHGGGSNTSQQPASSVAGGAAQQGAGSAAAEEASEATVKYLSSHKLFGLQLRDSTFRRNFLVQVLVLLDALRNPVKTEPLKAKQAEQAEALEAQVYSALEATPEDGKRFAAAVRTALAREANWAEWKRGPSWNVVPEGKTNVGCPTWHKEPAAPLEEAIDKAEAAAARPAKRARTSQPAPGPPDSKVDKWLRSIPEDNLDGLQLGTVQIPKLETFSQEVFEQMDPTAGIEDEFKLKKDPVFRWKLARLLAFKNVELATVDEAEIDKNLCKLLPDMVPESLKPSQPDNSADPNTPAAQEAAAADAAKAEAAADAAMEAELSALASAATDITDE